MGQVLGIFYSGFQRKEPPAFASGSECEAIQEGAAGMAFIVASEAVQSRSTAGSVVDIADHARRQREIAALYEHQ